MDGTLGEDATMPKGVLPDAPEASVRMSCRNINVFYGDKQAIYDVSLQIADRSVTSLIGPSGCGKSTFLRCLNRMNDTIEGCRVEGEIMMEGKDINSPSIDPVLLRSRVGMVFQKPNPFPKSIYENIAYGPRIHGLAQGREDMDEIVEKRLRRAGLWEELHHHRDPFHATGCARVPTDRLLPPRYPGRSGRHRPDFHKSP